MIMHLIQKIGIIALLTIAGGAVQAGDISGAGSSAAKPLYTSLASVYAIKSNTALAYEASGSSDGLKQISASKVDFGATDVALTAAVRAKNKLVCVPTAISGVVPVINFPGVRKGQLNLTGEVLADIFARKIVKWNDQRLRAINPALPLPDLAITIITRLDGSGTTFNFTDYLSKVSPEWKSAYGSDFTIKWPEGAIQVKGSDGVVAALKQTVGAIAYVDYQYAVKNSLVAALLKNQDGKFIAAGPAAFTSSLVNSAWMSKGTFEEMLTNRPGKSSWPITSGTFVLLPQVSSNPPKTIAAIKFLTWGFVHGDDVVGKAEFVRLPDIVQGRIFGELSSIKDAGGAPLKWSLAEVL